MPQHSKRHRPGYRGFVIFNMRIKNPLYRFKKLQIS